MNNKITKALIVCVLLSLLTGCFPSGELKTSSEPAVNSTNNVTPSASSDNSEPDAPKELENVKFNISLSDDYPSEVPIIKASLHTFDADELEELKAMFLDGKSVIKENIYEDGGNFYTADGALLSVFKNHFSFSVNHMYDGEAEKSLIYNMQYAAVINVKELPSYFPHIDSELEGFPRSEALLRANEIVEKLELKYLDEPKIYAFTAEEVKSYGEHNFFNKENDEKGLDVSVFSKEDEFYLVRYLTAYNGIPIPIESNQIFEGEYSEFSKIDIMLTKDEVIDVSCYQPFDNIEEVGKSQIKFGAREAMSKFYEYYSVQDAIMKYQLKYYDLGLAYITYESDRISGEFTYKPLWYMTGDFNMIAAPDKTRFTCKYADPVSGVVFNTTD